MILKHERPDFVINFQRPKGTEIKYIKGNWYLYERKGYYDPVKKRNHKVSGKMLGKITPQGFVPRKEKVAVSEFTSIQNVEYGASTYLYQSNRRMLSLLKRYFPNSWQKIFSMAVLRCLGESTLKRIANAYEESWLSILFGDLHMSKSQLCKDMRELGRGRASICSYMRNTLEGYQGFLLIDGHRLISESKGLPFAQFGCDSRMRYSRQINLLYMFGHSERGCMPLYYKQFAGSVPDCMALPDISMESGIKGQNITVIADKGFCAEDDFAALVGSGLKYIIPLKRNTREIDEIPPGRPEYYEKIFNYQQRSVFCKHYDRDGYVVYLYYDMQLAMQETNDAIDRQEKKNNANAIELEQEAKRRSKGRKKLSDEEIAQNQPVDIAKFIQERPEIGTFVIKTNRLDLNCAQVYMLYKIRQEIEESFKCYDDTLDLESSCIHDPEAFEGWLFINHLANQMLFGVLDHVASLDLTQEYSFKDVIKSLKGIRINNISGEWYASKYTKNTKKLCEDLDIDIVPSPSQLTP